MNDGHITEDQVWIDTTEYWRFRSDKPNEALKSLVDFTKN